MLNDLDPESTPKKGLSLITELRNFKPVAGKNFFSTKYKGALYVFIN